MRKAIMPVVWQDEPLTGWRTTIEPFPGVTVDLFLYKDPFYPEFAVWRAVEWTTGLGFGSRGAYTRTKEVEQVIHRIRSIGEAGLRASLAEATAKPETWNRRTEAHPAAA